MSAEIKAESGQGWARSAVAIGAALSVSGNITHTVLTDSSVHLAIRIVQAAFLPVILFFAVEVFVRVAWRRRAVLDFVGRAMLLLFPGFGAGYVSYFHLRDLAVLSGEDRIGSIAGPLAIDGLMIGGTVALLAIRAARLAEQLPIGSDPKPSYVVGQDGETVVTEAEYIANNAASDEAPALAAMHERVMQRRSARGQTDPALRDAVLALLDERSPLSMKDAAEKHGVARSTLGRYGTLRTLFRNEPQADVPPALAGKVRTDLVAIVRDAMNRERAL